MGSGTNQKAAKHFGAVSRVSWTINLSFGAITAEDHQMELPFMSKARLTPFSDNAQEDQGL
jgi:hypothetical protein